MAFYDYVCEDCKVIYEDVEQKMSDKHVYTCKKCGKEIYQDYSNKRRTIGFDHTCASIGYGIDGDNGWCSGGSYKNYKPLDCGGDRSDEFVKQVCGE